MLSRTKTSATLRNHPTTALLDRMLLPYRDDDARAFYYCRVTRSTTSCRCSVLRDTVAMAARKTPRKERAASLGANVLLQRRHGGGSATRGHAARKLRRDLDTGYYKSAAPTKGPRPFWWKRHARMQIATNDFDSPSSFINLQTRLQLSLFLVSEIPLSDNGTAGFGRENPNCSAKKKNLNLFIVLEEFP